MFTHGILLIHIHRHNGTLLPIKNKILPSAKIWIDLESIKRNVSDKRMTNTVWFHLHVESKMQNKLINIRKQKQRLSCRKQTGDCQSGRMLGEERNRWGRVRGTNLQLQNKWVMRMKCKGRKAHKCGEYSQW